MMVHDRVQDLASAALDFDLTPAERAELDDHLGSCAVCAGFAAGLRRDIEAASTWPTFDVPVRVRQTVFAALDGTATISQPRAVPRLSLALVLLLAMLALLAVVIGSSRGPSGLLAVIEGDTLYTLDPSSLQRSIVTTVQPLPSGQLQWPVRWSANGHQLFLADGRAVNADGTHAIEAPYPGRGSGHLMGRVTPTGTSTMGSRSPSSTRPVSGLRRRSRCHPTSVTWWDGRCGRRTVARWHLSAVRPSVAGPTGQP